MSSRKITCMVAGGVAALAAISFGMPVAAQEMEAAAQEYETACAVCHGISGRGDGNLVQFLNVKPTDLTKLSANNDGVFPFLKVFQIVDGRTLVSGHGERDMPVWGNRYQEEIGETYGPYGGERAVRARVLELVYYIQSIQE
jgi:mono/diheme cytochrome c family protein